MGIWGLPDLVFDLGSSFPSLEERDSFLLLNDIRHFGIDVEYISVVDFWRAISTG